MKAFLSFVAVALTMCPCAFADYYRATGGGVYELYVDDCSPAAMRRALDNATASRHAVITSVKCAAPRAEMDTVITTDIFMEEIETIPAEFLCPCELVALECGC